MFDTSFVLSRLNYFSIIDILLVTFIFYWILRLIQGTQAVQLLRGILIILVLAAISSSFLEPFIAFRWLLSRSLPALLISIPIIFQPELRRALDRLGSTGQIITSSQRSAEIEQSIEAVVTASIYLSQEQHGALIVFERSTGLGDYIETGITLNALTTPELLITIFFPNTPLHDGGVIIRNDCIVAAATVFPLGNTVVSSDNMLGTRHRAAIGVSEITDAIALVVSEETGIISIAVDGTITRNLGEAELRHILKNFYASQLHPRFSSWNSAKQSLSNKISSRR
ncbi:diadenylate cyclase CdaA [Anaerolineales bacterium HSG6]|nr:diadenylate cyclase CdaA [Anaerolineales bacterium HSG6]MDM8531821.1 diadenylate cyclase CdaA [Anaerolineales bacterium HSG25]